MFFPSKLWWEMEEKIAVIAFQGFPIMDFYFSQPQKNVNYFGTFIPNITSQKYEKKKQPTFGQNISYVFCSETNCLYLQLVILQQHLFVASLTQHQSVAKTFPDFSFINAQMHSFWSLQGRSWLEIFTICSFSYLILLSKNFANNDSAFLKFSSTFWCKGL